MMQVNKKVVDFSNVRPIGNRFRIASESFLNRFEFKSTGLFKMTRL